MTKAKPIILGVLAATALGTGAVAFASVGDSAVIRDKDGVTTQQRVASASAEITNAFAAFGASRARADRAAQQALRDVLGATSRAAHGPIGTADFAKASSAAIQGTSTRAWIVPSGDQACLVLPDAVDGYGASCGTLRDIAAGRGFVALGPPAGSTSQTATVAAMVPDRGAAPTITQADGSRTALRVDGNVAAAVVRIDTGATLQTGTHSTPLSAFARPEQ
jgi:hypothetical protein